MIKIHWLTIKEPTQLYVGIKIVLQTVHYNFNFFDVTHFICLCGEQTDPVLVDMTSRVSLYLCRLVI